MEAGLKAQLFSEGGKIASQLLRLVLTQSSFTKTSAELATEEPASAATPSVASVVEAKVHGPDLPTSAETTAILKRRLAKELYKAELDLTSGLKIAGKPCDCLDHKHGLYLEAAAEELVSQDPSDSVYLDIIEWVRSNQPKVSVEAISSGRYAAEYPHMALKFKGWRKHIMGSAADRPAEPLTLDQAKRLAAQEAEREVERQWKSPATK